MCKLAQARHTCITAMVLIAVCSSASADQRSEAIENFAKVLGLMMMLESSAMAVPRNAIWHFFERGYWPDSATELSEYSKLESSEALSFPLCDFRMKQGNESTLVLTYSFNTTGKETGRCGRPYVATLSVLDTQEPCVEVVDITAPRVIKFGDQQFNPGRRKFSKGPPTCAFDKSPQGVRSAEDTEPQSP